MLLAVNRGEIQTTNCALGHTEQQQCKQVQLDKKGGKNDGMKRNMLHPLYGKGKKNVFINAQEKELIF